MSWKSRLFSNPYLSLLRTAWKYAQGERKRYLLIYFLFTLSNLTVAAFPIIWGLFINELQLEGTNALRAAWIYGGIYILLRMIDWTFHGPARVMERQLAFNLSRNFLNELYHKAIHLPVKWHQDNHSGVTINRIRKAYEALKEFFDNGFMYFQSIAKFIFALSAMIYFSPLFGSIAVAMGLGVAYIILKFDKPFIAYTHQVNEKEHLVSSNLFDSLSNIITVITLRLEKRMEAGLFAKVMDILPPFVKKIRINEWKWCTTEICIALIYAVILIGYMYQNWQPGEVFLIGTLVILMGYVDQFTHVFFNIAWQYTNVVRFNTDVQAAQNIIQAYEQGHIPEESNILDDDWQELRLRNLNFSHNLIVAGQEKKQGLYNLNFQINKGQKVALIGESGSGKSTLLALLRGLYAPEKGTELIIDQTHYEDLGLISNYVTLFPQEPEIFENSILYNITLGLETNQEQVDKVCDTAHFTEVAKLLPKGFESDIKEKGVNLSGGQKQRLALARGVLAAQQSDIILLDEPTSSVDPKTELLIYEKMFEEFKNKAVISALHRLHLLPKFDYVYILENGRVIDQGTFEHLRANSPVFQDLWRHQGKEGIKLN